MIASYRADSTLTARDGRTDVALETALGATPLGYIDHPRFFTGFLARPNITASGLLTVADVAGSRYFDVSAVRARSLDPVVTATGDRLRFESFSADNGVYARLDLLADGIESGEVSFGTTNVDINPPLRSALSNLSRAEVVHLAVGSDDLGVSTIRAHHIERRVEMPDRWIRGFAETPALAARMTARARLQGTQVTSFLNGLPRGIPGPSYFLAFTPAGIRQSLRPLPDSVRLAGTGRLSAATRIARYADILTIYGSDDGSSGWVFELPGARLTLLLSPEPYRGFSGEGSLLTELARSRSTTLADRVGALLAWESVVDPAWVASEAGLSLTDANTGLAQLAASGILGYDLVEQAWFHRELPTDPDRVEGDNPRLAAARALVDSKAVTRADNGWIVQSDDHKQYVDTIANDLRCSCQWWAKYQGSRGPCKHVLAVRMLEGT